MLSGSNHRMLTERNAIKSFLLAGNAHFTLVSKKTGDHFAYQVRKSKRPLMTDHYFVSTAHGEYFLGTLKNDLQFIQRSKSAVAEKYILPFRWFLHHIGDPQLELWHEGTCGMCNRPLTDPISIARGIGPECIKKLEGKTVKELFA